MGGRRRGGEMGLKMVASLCDDDGNEVKQEEKKNCTLKLERGQVSWYLLPAMNTSRRGIVVEGGLTRLELFKAFLHPWMLPKSEDVAAGCCEPVYAQNSRMESSILMIFSGIEK